MLPDNLTVWALHLGLKYKCKGRVGGVVNRRWQLPYWNLYTQVYAED